MTKTPTPSSFGTIPDSRPDNYIYAIISMLFAVMMIVGCSRDEEGAEEPALPSTQITVIKVNLHDIDVIEESIGYLESTAAPAVSAEVQGRIEAIYADVGQVIKKGQLLALLDKKDFQLEQDAAQSKVKRLIALIDNQAKQVKRFEVMVKENFVTTSRLDEAQAQLTALKEQLAGARARMETAKHNLGKVKIISHTAGRVEKRLVAEGDFVKVGAALFHITQPTSLQAHLPFPENIAGRLSEDLSVRLTTPATVDKTVQSHISEIRPTVGKISKSVDVIVEFNNPGSWKAGASVHGVVILEQRPGAVMVPEISIVRRPAGSVVYVIKSGLAHQQVVTTGVHHDGLVEILSGLSSGETIAKDGAAYLTEGARVQVSSQHEGADKL